MPFLDTLLALGRKLQWSGNPLNSRSYINLTGSLVQSVTDDPTNDRNTAVFELTPRLTPTDGFTAIQWLLNETSSPWANTGNGGAINMATGQYGTARSRTGLFGNALQFSAAQVQTPTTSTVGETAGNLSVSVWFKMRAGTGTIGEILGKRYRNDNTWATPYSSWAIEASATTGEWYVSIATLATPHTVSVTAPDTIPLGVWTLLSFTYEPSTGVWRIYLNGTLLASTVLVGNNPIDFGSHGPYEIGGIPTGTSQCLDGTVDDARVEPGVLRSAAYYLAMYKAGLRLLDP